MKVILPIRAEKPARRGERALTLLEMMVAVTLLLLIVMGLTTMFLQTQKAFKSGLKQVDIFEGQRLVMDMIGRDIEQMAAANQGTSCYNFYVSPYDGRRSLVQTENGQALRGNYAQEFFALTRTSDQWIGIGYAVSNALSGGDPTKPGVGTLYRYTVSLSVTTNTSKWLLYTNYLFNEFAQDLRNPQNPYTNFHRVADGVIHFAVRPLDTNGNYVVNGDPAYSFPCTNYTFFDNVRSTNYLSLPGFVEVELGMLEPETFEQARSMGSYQSATNFLATRASRVHVFRQQIPIRAASR